MRQFCLWSQPPILISCILLLYCLQAPFWLCICMPASSFAQSAGQAGQLDLLHVLQGFILGVLQEVTLALRTHRQTGRESQGSRTLLGTKSKNTTPVSAELFGTMEWDPGPVSNPLRPPSAPLSGRDWSPLWSSAHQGRQQPAHWEGWVWWAPNSPLSRTPLGRQFGLL